MAEPLISVLLEQLFSISEVDMEGEGLVKGVEEDIERLSSNLAAVQPVLVDAEIRQFREDSVRRWLDELQDLCYEADAVFDEWRTAILKSKIEKQEEEEEEGQIGLSNSHKVCFSCVVSSCFRPFSKSHRIMSRPQEYDNIARKIKQLNQKLDHIATEKDRFGYIFNLRGFEQRKPKTSSFIDVSEVCGRDKEKEVLISQLLSKGSKDYYKIGLVGMGGIGKTTLAQLVYNDQRVIKYYECRIWVCVGHSFDFVDIAKEIIDTIAIGYVPNLLEMESNLLTSIYESINGKRFLLVLDDVCSDDVMKWEQLEGCLKHGADGSRVLVTTRNEKVAFMMRVETHMLVHLQSLSDESCWQIFSNLAYFKRKRHRELDEIGRRIVQKCNGLPLLAKTLGSVMRSKKTKKDWQDILHSELWQLEQVRKSLSAPFFTSYFDLPLLEKRCLLYCLVFPKDFHIDRADLIELWMSQGYLDDSKIFEIGEKCFDSLVLRSIFGKEFYGNIEKYKMHLIMHDFLRFFTRDKWFETWEVSNRHVGTYLSDETTRHFTLLLRFRAQIPISIYDKKKLRTLFVKCSETSLTPLNLDLIPELTCLRALYLRGCGIEKLPPKIDKLVYLRYLNLSDNSYLEELPSDLCNLINLQTLKLNNCFELGSLPDRMGKLVNLRHLYIDGCDQLEELPKGIGSLASLEIFDMFVVPTCADGLNNNNKTMRLGDLNNLKLVKGYLHIRGIGNIVANIAGVANKAQLKEKRNLVGLKLTFSRGSTDQPRRTEEESAVLLEALEPHPNLQSLEIREYHGATFSSWIYCTLFNLRRLVLSGCPNCMVLPPLGKLPSLESLHIVDMRKVRRVGLEFLRIMETTDDESNTTRESKLVSFPKLKQLNFEGLYSWEEWFGSMTKSNNIMPCLGSLRISFCYRLQTLPDFMATLPVLQDLVIEGCQMLEKRLRERVGEEWPKISHIPKIRINASDPRDIGTEETEASHR